MKPDTYREVPVWLGKLLCKIGWHRWSYILRSGETIMFDSSNVSKERWACERCGAKLN